MTRLRRRLRFAFVVGIAVPIAAAHVAALRIRPAPSVAGDGPHPRGLLPVDDPTLSAAVSLASRAVPRCTCLPQAQTMRTLMALAGRRGTVRFGVTRDAGVGFAAHAWVEDADGRIVHGSSERDYTPMRPARRATP